jgi:hypothetical protein
MKVDHTISEKKKKNFYFSRTGLGAVSAFLFTALFLNFQ